MVKNQKFSKRYKSSHDSPRKAQTFQNLKAEIYKIHSGSFIHGDSCKWGKYASNKNIQVRRWYYQYLVNRFDIETICSTIWENW